MKEKFSKKSATQKFRGRHEIVSPSPRNVKCAKKTTLSAQNDIYIRKKMLLKIQKDRLIAKERAFQRTKKRHSKPAGFPFLIEIRLDIL